jgi:hypothetical protein
LPTARRPKWHESGTKLAPRSPAVSSGAVTRRANSIAANAGGTVELEPELTAWLDGLADDELGHAERYIDLPADQGALLDEPFTRQLDGKLRALRCYLGRQQTRITSYIATGRNIVLHGVRQDQTERTNRDRSAQ